MTSEFLEGALAAYRSSAGQEQAPPSRGAAAVDRASLARARELVDELLEMVGRERRRVAALEAERDRLLARRQPPTAAPPSPAQGPDDGRARRQGELRRALESALAAPRRRRAALAPLMGGDGA